MSGSFLFQFKIYYSLVHIPHSYTASPPRLQEAGWPPFNRLNGCFLSRPYLADRSWFSVKWSFPVVLVQREMEFSGSKISYTFPL